ncbi:MAG TPA: RNA 2',3'-cyclic phosphodiesterase [Actinomycetota bacterium]|nr:RNA 2',3'-cyclic phosphodiesterase [Actinomycetota bacterium]
MAVDVPERQKASVETAVAPLKAVLPGARWTAAATWHVTLKFFGEVAEDGLENLRNGIGRAVCHEQAIGSRLGDVGAFPSMNRARVLWVGVEDPEMRLSQMSGRIGRECGLDEDRPLHPHLTLARMKVPAAIGPAVDRFRPFELEREPFAIDRVTLYRSYTERTGSRYEVLHEWELSTR